MLKKLRNKFLLVTMVLVSVMLLVIFSLVYYFTKVNLENQSINIARSAAQSAMQAAMPGSRLEEGLPAFTIKQNIFGQISVSGSSYYDLTDEAFVMTLLQQVEESRLKTDLLEEYSLRFYREVGCVAFVDVSAHQATLQSLIRNSMFIGVLSFALFYAISFLLAKWAVKPVEQAWNQQRQFVSDASHELKTPLTVIISNAELLQTQPEDTEKYSRNILIVSRQMRCLVEGLLELARADNGRVKTHFALMNVSKLTQDAALAFEAVFFENGLELRSNIQQDIAVTGDAQYLYQVVDILLDNARKYSAPGIVDLQLQKQGHNCLLTVTSSGTPIPREELEKIFQRFYRVDKARSGAGGFGLGLSIAKSIVGEHGGKIWAENTENGNRFSVLLPLAKEKR